MTRDVLLGAIGAGLAALGDHGRGGAAGVEIDPSRVEHYLRATMLCITPHVSPDCSGALEAVIAACDHLRQHELPDAYLALHAARDRLTS